MSDKPDGPQNEDEREFLRRLRQLPYKQRMKVLRYLQRGNEADKLKRRLPEQGGTQ